MFSFRLIPFVLWMVFPVAAFAQPAPVPFHTVPYSLSSGTHDGRGESAVLAWREVIQIADAPWLRLRFGETNLGSASYLLVTSLLDGSSQQLNALSLSQWYNTSAFFNGDAVEVKLFVAPTDIDVYAEVMEVIVGERRAEGEGIESICGTTDDRTRSSNNRAGRVITVGCTGWIVSNGLHVTAGHCIDPTASVLQFNVPSSLSDGTIQHPPARDQYSINQQSITYQNGGVGNDWAVFSVFDNSETGLQPIAAYGVSFDLAQDLTPNSLRVTGYGVDGPAPNFGWPPPSPRNSDSQTQQTHLGSNANSSGTTMRHTADTQPGNSGSPIIDESTGRALGVHTHGGCTSTGGSNRGTSTYHSNFWNALNPPVSVTLDQQRQNGDRLSGTTIGRWNGSTFTEITIPAPPNPLPTINTTVGAREVLRGRQETVSNPTEKYRVWRRGPEDQLDTVQNHRGFTIRADDANLTSRFHPTDSTITIKTDLIDLPGTTGGNITFHDPWYIDYPDPNYGGNLRNRGMQEPRQFHSRSSPFNPNYDTPFPPSNHPYRGVFLNQGGPPEWNPPYYSVGAPNPNTIGGFESYFVNWTGHPDSVGYQNANAQQTGVVFKTSNATAVAKYKAHLASSSTQVTAFNTQRKMVRDRYGAYHMVYESAKQIWYTRSSNEGATWSPEVNITGLWAAPGAINRWPCLAYIPDAAGRADYDRLLVVWEAFDESYPSGRYIVVCELDIYGMLRTAPTDIDYWDAPGPSYPPVAGVITDGNRYGGFYYALVVWYDGARASLMGKVRLQQDNWSSPSSDLRPGVTDYSLASLTLRRDGPAVFEVDTLWHLAYVQENNLMYASIRLNAMGYPEIRRTETVVMGYDGVYIRTPSVAVNNADVCVTWAEDYWEFVTGAVRFSERIAQDKWSNPVGWFPTGGYYRNPVIAADNLHDRITLVWEDDGNRSLYVQRGGGGADWGSVSVLGAGLEPSLAAGMPGVVGELAAARIGGTLHRVSVYAVSFPDDMRMKLTSAGVEGRGGRIKFSHGLLHVGVLSAGREGEPVAFARLSDTARVGSLGQLERRLVSEPFAGTGTLQVRILFASTGQVPSGATLALVLRDAQTNDLLNVLARVSAGTDTLVSIAAPLTYGTRSVVLAVAASNCGRPRGYELERWFEASEASSHLARTTGEAQTQSQLPATFALHPNHPNPFNPTTTIRYDLPEDSHVSLVIYDVLGRKVAEVVNEVQGAGFKSVAWDASAVASGVYLARFTAIDENGSVKLSKTMKLVLAK